MICLNIKIHLFGWHVLFRVGFSSTEWFGTAFREIIYIICCTGGKEFRAVFSSLEWFGTEFRELASILVSLNGIPSCVLFRRRVQNRIMGVCFYFFFPRNGIPSCFLYRGRVRNGIPRFSVPQNNQNSVGNNHLFRLCRLPRNYFFVGNSRP